MVAIGPCSLRFLSNTIAASPSDFLCRLRATFGDAPDSDAAGPSLVPTGVDTTGPSLMPVAFFLGFDEAVPPSVAFVRSRRSENPSAYVKAGVSTARLSLVPSVAASTPPPPKLVGVPPTDPSAAVSVRSSKAAG